MKSPPLGPGGEDITWPDQVAPWGRKASSTRKIKPQTSYRTVRRSTGDSAGAPELFNVDADTPDFRSEDATPGTRESVRVRALLGWVGRTGLLSVFWCASSFLLPFCPSSLLEPLRSRIALVLLCSFSPAFFFFVSFHFKRPRCL